MGEQKIKFGATKDEVWGTKIKFEVNATLFSTPCNKSVSHKIRTWQKDSEKYSIGNGQLLSETTDTSLTHFKHFFYIRKVIDPKNAFLNTRWLVFCGLMW